MSLSIVLAAVTLTAGCSGSSPVGPSGPVTPPPVVANPDYSGDWRGGWRILSCDDAAPKPGFCASNIRRDFEPIRLTLTQSGRTVTGRMQARTGNGTVSGTIDDLGRLHLSGELPSEFPPHPIMARIVEWRTATNDSRSELLGGFRLEHFWGGDPQMTAAFTTTESAGIYRCTVPKLTGFFWEC